MAKHQEHACVSITGTIEQVEVITSAQRRRRWSAEEGSDRYNRPLSMPIWKFNGDCGRAESILLVPSPKGLPWAYRTFAGNGTGLAKQVGLHDR